MLDIFRNSAGAIAVFLVLAVISSLISANVRTAAAKRGWDTFLDRFIDQITAIPVIGSLVSGARAKIAEWGPLRRRWWLWLALGLSGGIAISLSVVSFSRPQVGGDELSKATAPLKSQISQLQAVLNNVTRARDDALRQAGLPQAPPVQSNLTADEIATKIDVWASIDQRMNDLAKILNEGYSMLDTWVADAKSNRAVEVKRAEALAESIAKFRTRLDNLRSTYADFPDIADALKEAVIPPGRPPVPGTLFDRLIRSTDGFAQELGSQGDPPPEDLEDEMRAKTGAVRRDLNAVREWQSATRQVGINERGELEKLKYR